MPVACAAASTFDRDVGWDRIRSGITLARVLETDRDFGLRAGHRHERNADRRAIVETCSKIGVASVGWPDRIHIRSRVAVNRQRVHARVPNVVGWKDRAAANGLGLGWNR